MRYDLHESDGFVLRIPVSPALTINPCSVPSPGSSFVHTYVLTGAARDHFEVERNEVWTLNLPCTPQAILTPDTVPSASCHATRTLHYELKTACAPPCNVIFGSNVDDLKCDCGG